MHPFKVANDARQYGWAYVYWTMREMGVSRYQTLRLMWIARCCGKVYYDRMEEVEDAYIR